MKLSVVIIFLACFICKSRDFLSWTIFYGHILRFVVSISCSPTYHNNNIYISKFTYILRQTFTIGVPPKKIYIKISSVKTCTNMNYKFGLHSVSHILPKLSWLPYQEISIQIQFTLLCFSVKIWFLFVDILLKNARNIWS
jgi:hypothetical protein